MKNRKLNGRRILSRCGIAALIAMNLTTPSYAGWYRTEENGKWKYQNEDGTWQSQGWRWIDGNKDGIAECYYFDSNGTMFESGKTPDGYFVNPNGAWTINGIVQTKNIPLQTERIGHWEKGAGVNLNRWWFDNGDGSYKKDGWYWIDGNKDGIAECYYFDPAGWLITDSVTVDGYTVDANGAWIVNGVVQTKAVGDGGGLSSTTSEKNTISVLNTSLSGFKGSGSGSESTISSGKGSGNGSSGGGSGSGKNNYKKEISQEEQDVIDAFREQYIEDEMTDFEKEMWIIRYLVDTVKYTGSKKGGGDVVHTSYGALVNKMAVCDGYSKAFQVLADACGLTVKTVIGDAMPTYSTRWIAHAWNLIKLDGKWYHVDVTWEDTSDRYGMDVLRNDYINLTDKEISSDHRWEQDIPSCKGETYSGLVVDYFMLSGEVDTEIGGDRWREYLIRSGNESEEHGRLGEYGYEMDDGSNFFENADDQEAIARYLENWFEKGYRTAYLVCDFENSFAWLNSDWVRETLGGSDWRVNDSQTTENGRRVKICTVSLRDGQEWIGSEKAAKILEQALEPENANLISEYDQLKEYVQNVISQQKEEIILVYPSTTELYKAYNVESAGQNQFSDVKRTSSQIIKVGEQRYNVCTYKVEYRTLEDKLKRYLNEDKSNFLENEVDFDNCLAMELSAPDGWEERFYVVYNDGKEGHSDSEYILKYAKENNYPVIKVETDHREKVVHEGKIYEAVRYKVIFEH